MARKRLKPDQVMTLLRQIELAVANGKTTPQACKDVGVMEQTYYRWRREYGGSTLDYGVNPDHSRLDSISLFVLLLAVSVIYAWGLQNPAEGFVYSYPLLTAMPIAEASFRRRMWFNSWI